jgi:hypothetical protein
MSYLKRELKEGGRERGVGGWVSRQPDLRLGLGEIGERDRDTEKERQRETERDRETELTIKIPSKAG